MMQVISLILSVLIYGILLFFVGLGMYKLIVYIKNKRKRKEEVND